MQSMHSAMLLRQIWLSVCQSVQRRLVGLQVSYFFQLHRRYKIPRGTHSAGALNTRKWYDIGLLLLWNTSRKSQMADPVRNRHNTLSAMQWHTSLGTLMQSMIWHLVRSVHHGHTKWPVRSPWKLTFCRGQWDASYTKTFSESAWRNDYGTVGNPTQHHWSSK